MGVWVLGSSACVPGKQISDQLHMDSAGWRAHVVDTEAEAAVRRANIHSATSIEENV